MIVFSHLFFALIGAHNNQKQASVDYHVTLRGNARDRAEAVVLSLKKVFGDSKARKRFLSNYWGRIPESVGVSPKRKKRSKESKHSSPKHSSPKHRESKEGGGDARDEEKRSKKDKKDKKRDKKKRRSSNAGPSDFDSDSETASPSSSSRRSSKSPKNKKKSAMGMLGDLANSILAGSTAEDGGENMLPALR